MRDLPLSLLRLLFLGLCGGLVTTGPALWAGGGPENVLLVVNPDSPSSLCIANHYAALRHIPAGNITFVHWDPKLETTDAETFRTKILLPVVTAARAPVPGRRIDYVVYSSDFPWAVSIDKDVEKLKAAFAARLESSGGSGAASLPPALKYVTPVASLNGLTYLWASVAANNPGYLDFHSNWYAQPAGGGKGPLSRGFASNEQYGANGAPMPAGGRQYLLSMMLAVTAGRGNTIDEVLNYLRRSAAADGTHPQGTIYYVENSDIRSRVRKDEFPAAVRLLKELGVAAEIDEGIMPQDKKDVQGAMLGTAGFHWQSSGSTILPGAICEHFTSFGGEMHQGSGQTPLSEFLRYGAAAASGTVTEPFSIAAKFPSAMIQVHYVRGCTAAESFYQSLLSPYQLLIVGDPLCRPWANVPTVTVEGVKPAATVSGMLHLKPTAKYTATAAADHFEFYVDGQRAGNCPPGGTFDFDSSVLPDGCHEFRTVAIERSAIRSQGEAIFPLMLANYHRTIEVIVEPGETLEFRKPLVLQAKAPGCARIAVLHGSRMVAMIAGEQGRAEVLASTFGAGPVRLQVIGVGAKPVQESVFARPLNLTIKDEPPPEK